MFEERQESHSGKESIPRSVTFGFNHYLKTTLTMHAPITGMMVCKAQDPHSPWESGAPVLKELNGIEVGGRRKRRGPRILLQSPSSSMGG